jgi:hypothetical protein
MLVMARNGGRPSKFTPDVKKTILETIAMGAPRCHAAERAGIDRSTLWGFLAKGKKDKKGEYFEFFNAVKKAEADFITVSMARIRKAASGGQVLERTTTTVTTRDSRGKTTTTVTTKERFSQGQWAADAWTLERRHPEHFALWRKKDMQSAMAAEVEKAIKDGRIKPPAPTGPTAPTLEQLRTIALESARRAKREYKPQDCPLAPPPSDEPIEPDEMMGSKKSPVAREMDDDE